MVRNDFDSLFRELFPPAYAVALRILDDRQDAEDAAAEALARAVISWRRLQAVPYQRAWVLRVTTNVAVDMLRRRARAPHRHGLEERAAAASDERLMVAGALRGLPRRQREVVALRYLADMTELQVAEHLRISVGAVKQHHRRGLAALRSALRPDDKEVSLAY